MTVRNNRIVHIEEHTPSHERRFIGWSDDPWTPEQMAAAIRQHPQQRVFWRSLLDPSEVFVVGCDPAAWGRARGFGKGNERERPGLLNED
jgi:hypothetical protein